MKTQPLGWHTTFVASDTANTSGTNIPETLHKVSQYYKAELTRNIMSQTSGS